MKTTAPYNRILIDFAALASEFVPLARLFTDRPQELLSQWPAGEPRFSTVAGVSASKLSRKIKAAGAAHFESMPAHPWASQLFQVCCELSETPITVLSGPPYFGCCSNGRIRWLRKFCGNRARYIAMNEKQRMARRGVLLIDPSEVACRFFDEAGGKSILFPLHINALHSVPDPLAHVLAQLRRETVAA